MLINLQLFADSFYMPWWPHWLSDLALEHGAVIISPNYRLLPEATTPEVFEDVEDVWNWVHSPDLKKLLAAHTTPTELDLSRLLTTGESAGGLLSVSLALSHPSEIRAATASYPCADFASKEFSEPRSRPPFGQHTPKEELDKALAEAQSAKAQSSITELERLGLVIATVEYGVLSDIYKRGINDEQQLYKYYPMKRLERDDVRIPNGGIAVIHGRSDSVVPLGNSERFIKRAREVTAGQPGNEKLVFTARDGEHGFDAEVRYEEQWLRDAFTTAVKAWME